MSFDNAFQKLQNAGEKVTSTRGDIPKNILKKSVHPAYDALCASYETTSLDQRVTTYLFFETRDNLLEALVEYAGARAQDAIDRFEMGKQEAALPLLKQAIAADLIANGRSDPGPIEETQQHLLNAIDTLGFNLDAYARKLDIPCAAFTKRAAQLQKESNDLEALKALGVALEMDPRLASHPKAMDMAERLTRKDAGKITPILCDRFERKLYLADQMHAQDKQDSRRKKKAESPLSFWLTTVGGGLLLAVLPPIIFPAVFGLTADRSGAPPGLIVGTVTSVMFVAGQLKRRKGGGSGGSSMGRTPRRRLNG